jgi:hypothetical protein
MITRADNRKFHYIYKITRFDGKYYYGLHSTDNLEDGYFGSGTLLWHSIRYHGKDKHIKEIVEFLSSRTEAKIREKAIVNEELIRDAQCMNLCIGGADGGHTESSIEKMKRPKPEGFGEKISKLKRGVCLSEEHKQSLSNAKIGKKTSEKHRIAVSLGHKGWKQSEEQKKNLSERMKGKPNMSAVKLQKPCTIDGEIIYPSVSALVAALGHGKNGIKSPNLRFI